MSDPRRLRLEEQRDRVLDDLLELERQIAAGELDPHDAARLRDRYETAAATALHAIDAFEAAPSEAPGRSSRRMVAGIVLFITAAAIVTVALVNAVEPRPEGGFVTGGVASDVVSDGGVDLDSVTNEQMEQVVAANPDVLPMRLALARRYFEEGDFSAALPHYMYVLERDPNAEAFMYVGWMTVLSGEAATGAAYLERSLQALPGNPLAQWLLANAYLELDDTNRALPLLDAVVASPSTPPELAEAASALRTEVAG